MLGAAVDDLYAGVTAEKLGRYALVLFGIALAAGVFRYFMRMAVIGVSRDIEYELRNHLFAHLQKLPLQYFQRERAGEILSRATNDLSAVRMMLGPGIMHFAHTVVMTLTAVPFMLLISPRLTLYALLPLPLVSLAVWWFGERIHRRFEVIQAQFADISARVQENLAGVRVVRAFQRERAELETFDGLNHGFLQRNLALVRTSGVFHPLLAFLSGLATLTAVYLGGRDVVKDRITLGDFVAFTVYLGMLNWPMMALGWVINLFQRGMASWRRLLEVLDVEPEITSVPDAWTPPAPADPAAGVAIEIRGLTFTYPGGNRPVLRDVSLTVPAGATVAIVGRTGAGKSTLLSLLPRVFDPPEGAVFVDGVDVRRWDLDALRARIGYAPQETFLFSTSVAGNVAYGVGAAPREAVERVAHIAQLDAEARAFPSGYDTLVGERGIALSGGQRQRVAIARALLRDAPLLVLDDSLSSVDTHTEEAILHGLAAEMRQRTTLIVSHRVSTIRDADFIVVLDDGAVVESGRHDDLLARDGLYAELHRRQQIEEELEAS